MAPRLTLRSATGLAIEQAKRKGRRTQARKRGEQALSIRTAKGNTWRDEGTEGWRGWGG